MSLAPVVNGNADFLQIVSPGQKTIGFIQRTFDGSWHIDSMGEFYFNAWRRDDGVWYLLRTKVWPTPFIVNGDSQSYLLVESSPTDGVLGISENDLLQNGFPEGTCTISFWDNTHGLQLGDRVAFKAVRRNRAHPGDSRRSDVGGGPGWVVLGDVSEVEGSRVALADVKVGFSELQLEAFLVKYALEFSDHSAAKCTVPRAER